MATKDDIKNMATKDDIAKIYDVMATKDDLYSLRKELKTNINHLRNEIVEHVDGFIKLHQTHESELAAITFRQNRMEKKLDLVIKKNNLKTA